MDWKISLDRYLTSPPEEDYYTGWVGDVMEFFSDDFFERNDLWLIEGCGQFDLWLNKLDGYHPKETAKIIERAFKLYKL